MKSINQLAETLLLRIFRMTDAATLGSCLRVCKAWYRFALPELYRDIVIDGHGAIETANLLLERTARWSAAIYTGLSGDADGPLPLRPDQATRSFTTNVWIFWGNRWGYYYRHRWAPILDVPRLNIYDMSSLDEIIPPQPEVELVVGNAARPRWEYGHDQLRETMRWAGSGFAGSMVVVGIDWRELDPHTIYHDREDATTGATLHILIPYDGLTQGLKARDGFSYHGDDPRDSEQDSPERMMACLAACGDFAKELHCHFALPNDSHLDLDEQKSFLGYLEDLLPRRKNEAPTDIFLHLPDDDIPPPRHMGRQEWDELRRRGRWPQTVKTPALQEDLCLVALFG